MKYFALLVCVLVASAQGRSLRRLIFVHAGSANGFVQDAELVFRAGLSTGDYHGQMNRTNFEKLLVEKLFPNIPHGLVIVLDNAPYHLELSDKFPTKYSTKQHMLSWLAEYLKGFACTRYDPNFEKCVFQGFENARPYFVKGIPELGFPPIDPFELPVMSVDRTINDLVSIKAVLRNVKMTGARNTVIDYLKADAINGTGEIRLTIPYCDLEMEYDVSGQLLSIPLQSKGFFQGNFTDTQLYIKGGVKRYQKEGVEYFRVGKLSTKITVGDGHIKLLAKNPELQFGADLIADFYNENPRRVMDAVNPIFVESSNELFKVVMDQILATLPASEWLPEK